MDWELKWVDTIDYTVFCRFCDRHTEFADAVFADHFSTDKHAISEADLVSTWHARQNLPPGSRERPSKLYCKDHNPGRSDAARRNYQRDRKSFPAFEALLTDFGTRTPKNSLDDIAKVRRLAYKALQAGKSAAGKVEALLKQGIKNQAAIARRLGVSRQAVSAAMKRRQMNKAPNGKGQGA